MLVRLTQEDSSSQKTDRFQAPLPPLLLYFSSTQMTTSAPSLSLRWLESFTIWINIKIELSKDIFQFFTNKRPCSFSRPLSSWSCFLKTTWSTKWKAFLCFFGAADQVYLLLPNTLMANTNHLISWSFCETHHFLSLFPHFVQLAVEKTRWSRALRDSQHQLKKGPVSLSESHAHMDLPLPERPQGSHLQGNQNHNLPRQEGFTLAKRQSAISSQSPLKATWEGIILHHHLLHLTLAASPITAVTRVGRSLRRRRASVWCHSNAPTCLGVLKSPRPVMIRQELLTKASASTSSSTIRWYFDFDPPIPTVVLQRKLCRFLTRVIRWICLVLCNKHFFKLQSYIKLQMIIRPTDDKRT